MEQMLEYVNPLEVIRMLVTLAGIWRSMHGYVESGRDLREAARRVAITIDDRRRRESIRLRAMAARSTFMLAMLAQATLLLITAVAVLTPNAVDTILALVSNIGQTVVSLVVLRISEEHLAKRLALSSLHKVIDA